MYVERTCQNLFIQVVDSTPPKPYFFSEYVESAARVQAAVHPSRLRSWGSSVRRSSFNQGHFIDEEALHVDIDKDEEPSSTNDSNDTSSSPTTDD